MEEEEEESKKREQERGNGDDDASSAAVARARNISRGLGSLTLQNVASSVLAFVFLGAVVRLLSPTSVGAYVAILLLIGILSTAANFGLSYAATRYVALYSSSSSSSSSGDQGDDALAWRAAKATLILAIVFSLGATAAFAIASPSLSLFFMKSTSWTGFFLLGSLWLFSMSLAIVVQGIIQGMKKYVALAKMLLISRIAMVALTVVGLLVSHDVDVAILAWVVYYAIIVAWCVKIFAGRLFTARGALPYSQMLRYSIPLGIAAILSIVSTSADQIVVGGYLSASSLAVYGLAVLISAVLNVVLVIPLTTAFLPEASSSSQNAGEVSNGMRLAIRFLVLALLPASFLIAALSNQFLILFSGNASYFAGAQSLELIATTYVFFGAQTAIYSLLQAVGRTIQALIVGFVIVALDIGGSLVLVPPLGLLGAAVMKVSVGIVGMVVAAYFARDYMRRMDPPIFYVKSFVASFTPFVILLFLSMDYTSDVTSLFPFALLGVVIFLACLKGLRVLSDQDRFFLSHALPRSFQRLLSIL